MRPDIAIASAYPPPGERHAGRTGVASYTSNLAHALVRAGASVAVCAPREPGCPERYDDAGVDVRFVTHRGLAALPLVAAAARSAEPRVVHVQHEMFLYGGASSAAMLPIALATLRREGALAVTMHQVIDPDEIDADFVRLHHVRTTPRLARAGIRAVNGCVNRFADTVVVHEPRFGRRFRRATVIPHGVETRPRADGPRARERLGLGDEPIVLCFGFVAPYKGLETALEASECADGAFTLVVAGADHPRAGAYGEELRRRWRHRARFTGHVDEGDLADLFAACDVALFCYPRPFSSSGAVALALAYRTPVLLSPPLADSMSAPRELVAPLDPPALAGAIASIVRSPTSLGSVGRASDRLARSRDWDTVARRHLETYEEVSDGERAAGRRLRAGQPR